MFPEGKKQSVIQIKHSGEYEADVRNGSSTVLNRQGTHANSKNLAGYMLGSEVDGKYLLFSKGLLVSTDTSLRAVERPWRLKRNHCP